MHDPSLIQNRCFLYHLIGNGTGEWRVPVGGMGAVTDALAKAAARGRRRDRHRRRRRARSDAMPATGRRAEVTWHDGSTRRTRVSARFVLANVAPWVLRILLGETGGRGDQAGRARSSRSTSCSTGCPRLKSGVDPAVAFAGTLHLGEDYAQLEAAYADAAAGRMPDRAAGRGLLPLADRPLDPRRLAGGHPHADLLRPAHAGGAVRRRPGRHQGAGRRPRDRVAQRAPAWSRSRPAWPATADGQPCIEAKIPQDIERDLAHAGRPHLPRRPRLAVGPEPGPPGHPRPAVGRRRPTTPRCCCAAPAPAEAAPSRASPATTPRRPSSPRAEPGSPIFRSRLALVTFDVASQRAPLAQLAEQLTLNQRVRGSSPRWRTTRAADVGQDLSRSWPTSRSRAISGAGTAYVTARWVPFVP